MLVQSEGNNHVSKINVFRKDRSLGESMIFHNYNRFRYSDSWKDFTESYGESAGFSEILEIDSESLKAAFICKIQKNDPGIIQNRQESLRIATIPCTLERASSS